jgi:outer membrane protein assembly factor BamB
MSVVSTPKETPLKSIVFSLLTGSLLLSAAMAGETGPSTGAVAKAVPLGHKDFYPSPQRPLGWRGDGSGAWPGATLTLSTTNGATNLVWRAPMPGPSFSQPLVIGEKVITQADPNWLVCVNVHDGKILWQTEIDHCPPSTVKTRETATPMILSPCFPPPPAESCTLRFWLESAILLPL